VKEADVRDAVHDALIVEFEKQPEHAMRARVLWPHIQDHRLTIDGAIRDQVAEFVDRDVQFLFQHKTSYPKTFYSAA
jgi:hypothetical protein